MMNKCKTMKKMMSLLLAAALMAGIVSGCGKASGGSAQTEQKQEAQTDAKQDSAAAETKAESETKADAESEAKADDAGRIVKDMMGREVAMPEKIETIATFGACGVLNTFIETMGRGSMICNEMAPNFTKTAKWAMQYEFAPQISGAPVLEGSDGSILIEEVLKLKPDLCFAMKADTVETLEQAGFTVVYFNWTTGDELKAAVTLLGEVLEIPDRAAEYCQYFDDTLKKAQGLVASLDEKDKRKAIYGDIVNMSNPHKISEWWIEQGGGISVTKEAHTDESLSYTLEDLLAWNPDVIFVTANQAEEIKANANLASIPAVKNDAIYLVPCVGHTWGNRSTEQPLVILWTISKLYPEMYSADALKADVKEFYSKFFSYELSDEQLGKIVK